VSVTVEVVSHSSTELFNALRRLVPQLSSSAAPLTLSALDNLLMEDSSTLVVAKDDDEIIGTLTLVVFSIPTGLRAIVEDVIVDNASRGKGVGEQLVAFALRCAKERGAKTVDLTSRSSREAANALYQKMGFVLRETNVYRFFLEDS
jgi:ribosomal protein S18 acetylase RimI-like enzyme